MACFAPRLARDRDPFHHPSISASGLAYGFRSKRTKNAKNSGFKKRARDRGLRSVGKEGWIAGIGMKGSCRMPEKALNKRRSTRQTFLLSRVSNGSSDRKAPASR